MSKKLNLPEHEICNLYLNNKLSKYKISTMYNCSTTTIDNILKRNNIKLRTSYETNCIILPDEKIINLYINKKLSLSKISVIYNCCYVTIGKVLQRNNIELRSASEAQDIKNNLNILDKDIIYLYTIEKMSKHDISKLYNCSVTPIHNILINNNIELRSHCEVATLKFKLDLPEEKIINLYINSYMNINNIANMYNCSNCVIRNILINNNVELRSMSEACIIRNGLNLPEEKIINLYINKLKSITTISNIYNCSFSVINNLLKRNNIELRLQSDKHKRFCIKCGHEFMGTFNALYCPDCSPNEYCYKWNENCREHNRNKYNRECFFCGKTENDNERKLSVHHIDYNKNQGCNKILWKLIPLCQNCHGLTGGSKENRNLWESRILYLHKEYWNNVVNG